jgi:hypothetical protein
VKAFLLAFVVCLVSFSALAQKAWESQLREPERRKAATAQIEMMNVRQVEAFARALASCIPNLESSEFVAQCSHDATYFRIVAGHVPGSGVAGRSKAASERAA